MRRGAAKRNTHAQTTTRDQPNPSQRPTLPPLLPPPNPRPQQPAQATMLWVASPTNKESVSVNTRRVRHSSTTHVLVESAQASVASTHGAATTRLRRGARPPLIHSFAVLHQLIIPTIVYWLGYQVRSLKNRVQFPVDKKTG